MLLVFSVLMLTLMVGWQKGPLHCKQTFPVTLDILFCYWFT